MEVSVTDPATAEGVVGRRPTLDEEVMRIRMMVNLKDIDTRRMDS